VEYPVRITTQMLEIEGTLETPGRFDFTALMTDGARDFIPIFNATMTGTLLPNLRVESATLLVNRRKSTPSLLNSGRNHKVKSTPRA
jgi:hypothetical protein